jgi:hypothetical protein
MRHIAGIYRVYFSEERTNHVTNDKRKEASGINCKEYGC